jgi:hypothetical protein
MDAAAAVLAAVEHDCYILTASPRLYAGLDGDMIDPIEGCQLRCWPGTPRPLAELRRRSWCGDPLASLPRSVSCRQRRITGVVVFYASGRGSNPKINASSRPVGEWARLLGLRSASLLFNLRPQRNDLPAQGVDFDF